MSFYPSYQRVSTKLLFSLTLLIASMVQAEENTIPQDLLNSIIQDVEESNFSFGSAEVNKNIATDVAKRMYQLMPYLTPLMEEDKEKAEEDKQYQLSASMTAFVYLMHASAEAALKNGLERAEAKELSKVIALLKKYNLVIDHPLSKEMLNVISHINFSLQGNNVMLTLYTLSNKNESITFQEKILSPRLVIKGLVLENPSSFVFSDLLSPSNKESLNKLKKDSQKSIAKLVLMDEYKNNVPDYFDQQHKEGGLRPLKAESKGFLGKGSLKGIRLPSPSVKLKTMYLLPGRKGSPAIVKAKAGFLKPLVAL